MNYGKMITGARPEEIKSMQLLRIFQEKLDEKVARALFSPRLHKLYRMMPGDDYVGIAECYDGKLRWFFWPARCDQVTQFLWGDEVR